MQFPEKHHKCPTIYLPAMAVLGADAFFLLHISLALKEMELLLKESSMVTLTGETSSLIGFGLQCPIQAEKI